MAVYTAAKGGPRWASLHYTVENMKNDTAFTPDIQNLSSRYYTVPVFIPGEHKDGFALHRLIKHCTYVGQGFTRDPEFLMVVSPTCSPAVFWFKDTPSKIKAHIKGEIYNLPMWALTNLDIDHENTVSMVRARVPIWYVPKKESKKPTEDQQKNFSHAFMYCVNPEAYGSNFLKMSKTLPLYKHKSGHLYYEYRKRDEKHEG